jgi:hypothetical protein
MKDVVGQELEQGCMVAFSTMDQAGTNVGMVKHLTPKGVRILYKAGPESYPRLADIAKSAKAVVRIQATTEELSAIIKWIVAAQLDRDIQ